MAIKNINIDNNILPIGTSWENIDNKPIITSWSDIPSDNNIPSEKLVKDLVNTKADQFSVSSANNTAAYDSEVIVGNVAGTDLKFTMPSPPSTGDTKNTAGSTATTSKIFLVGATTQSEYAQTYTDSAVSVTNGELTANTVYNAVWNDLADSIPVDEECILEYGYCYCFDGKKYTKSSKYLDEGIIGIYSDTYGFKMGSEEGKKKIDIAVAGFVLAYVDKEYPAGTPLTCTENGYLTEIKKEDKIEYPERIVATYWKNEPTEEWGSNNRKVKVNGRKWVKIK